MKHSSGCRIGAVLCRWLQTFHPGSTLSVGLRESHTPDYKVPKEHQDLRKKHEKILVRDFEGIGACVLSAHKKGWAVLPNLFCIGESLRMNEGPRYQADSLLTRERFASAVKPPRKR
ncbi:hypothetical protein SAMN05216411_103104 [Nitrosospira multiformis]|nr:hypothetical protein SAMN05216411_103104 [Nitrosospira multiformis]